MKHTYQVHVGNAGTVYSGPSVKDARLHFDSYVAASRRDGRVAGESVSLTCDGDDFDQFIGANDGARLKQDARW